MAGSVGVGRAAPRSSPKRYAGTDPPLSLAGPTMADLQRTAELEKFLVEAGLYEGKEESAKREEVLSEIGQVILCFLFCPLFACCLFTIKELTS